MARCSNEAVLNLVGAKKLEKTTVVDLRLRRDLPDCRKINTKSFVDNSATNALGYNKYKKPVNRFECNRTGCITTGVLSMNEADETVTYRAMYDATEWANGVVTFYVQPDASLTDSDYPITVTLAVSEAIDFTNADVYTVSVTKDMVTDDGFVPLMVNLANAPASVEGNGWTPDSTGAFLRLSADKKVGYSSISIYDSIDDFDLLEAVQISCLTTAGGPFDLEVVTQRCQEAKYNDEIETLNFPVTGTKISGNWMNLFPMLRKGNATKGYVMTAVEKTVDANGRITLADANQDVCGYITAQAADSCAPTEALYIMSSANSVEDVDDGHFIVVKNQDGSTDIVFNQSQADVKMRVRYPRQVDIEEWVANADNLNSSELSMTVPYEMSDDTLYNLVFEKVFVTSFPMTITSDTNEFAFQFAIGRDANGNFIYVQKVIG